MSESVEKEFIKGLSNERKELIESKYKKVKDLLDELHEEFNDVVTDVQYNPTFSQSEDEKDDYYGMCLWVNLSIDNFTISLR